MQPGRIQDLIRTNLEEVRRLCRQMLELADSGDRYRRDVGCGVVYGHLRDSAYKILQLAERELQEHGVREPRSVDQRTDCSTQKREAEEP